MQLAHTWLFGVDHIQNLADGVLDREAVDIEFLQLLEHLLVEVHQLKQRQNTVSVEVKTSKPVFDTRERERERGRGRER